MPAVDAFSYVNLCSCDTSSDIGLDLGVEIDDFLETPQPQDQRIARLAVVALLRHAILPPAGHRIDGDVLA